MKNVLQSEKLITGTFNNYFCNIVKNLSITKYSYFENQTSNLCADRVNCSIKKYKGHPRIICTKDKISSMNN